MKRAVIVAAVLAVAAVGCGTKQSAAPIKVGALAAPHAPATTTPSSTVARAGVGASYKMTDGTTTYNVTLGGVLDPAPVAASFLIHPGSRVVAAKFTIATTSGGPAGGNANLNASMVGADGQTYSPAFHEITGCTNFAAGEFTVDDGKTATGCVSFEIPTAVKVSEVHYAVAFGGGKTAEWDLP